jgi:hypothetical protein
MMAACSSVNETPERAPGAATFERVTPAADGLAEAGFNEKRERFGAASGEGATGAGCGKGTKGVAGCDAIGFWDASKPRPD